jgi:hypothetical protein
VSAAVKAPRRLLPGFSRWATGLYAFGYRRVIYFASRDSEGRWQVVAEGAEEQRIGPGGTSKAAAVRAALDAIDNQDQDQEEVEQ